MNENTSGQGLSQSGLGADYWRKALPEPGRRVLQTVDVMQLWAQVTGSGPTLTVEQSTYKHLELIKRLTTADSGKFISAPTDEDILY